MSRFTSELKIKVIDNGKNFENLLKFEYYRENNKDEVIVVPKGFVTNFASIPRLFWSIYPPLGYGKGFNYAKSAMLHDYLYSKGALTTGARMPRKECDLIFLESMLAVGVYKFNAYLFYYCVRLFGKKNYEKG